MMSPPKVQDLILRNIDYQQHHASIVTFEERFAAGEKGPKVAVVACADPRCIPEQFLDLKLWEVVVIRTAGSNVKGALASLIAIDSFAGLEEIMVINHTDCGALVIRDNLIKIDLRDRAPDMGMEIDGMQFGEITGTLEDRVRTQINFARDTPLLRKELREKVTGYVYNLKDGSLVKVE